MDAQEPRTYLYVPHHLVLDYARLGWLPHDSLADTPHGRYAVLMEWMCQCPLLRPPSVSVPRNPAKPNSPYLSTDNL